MFTNETICEGYLRKDGRKGIRNKLLIIYTVECCSMVAKKIGEYYEQLGEDVEVIGTLGCYDNQVIIRKFLSYSIHPNVGATLIVGHGCEFTQADKISKFAVDNGRISDWFTVQTSGGTTKSIEKWKKLAGEMLKEIKKKAVMVPLFIKDLVIGGECGGSDFTSGLAANPLVGSFFTA